MDVQVVKNVAYHLDLAPIDMTYLIGVLRVGSNMRADTDEEITIKEWAYSWFMELQNVKERAES
jgi:hypothetical protein